MFNIYSREEIKEYLFDVWGEVIVSLTELDELLFALLSPMEGQQAWLQDDWLAWLQAKAGTSTNERNNSQVVAPHSQIIEVSLLEDHSRTTPERTVEDHTRTTSPSDGQSRCMPTDGSVSEGCSDVSSRGERFDTRATKSFESLNDPNSVKFLSEFRICC